MGQQAKRKDNNASVLIIDQACESDQLLVSLSKNGSQWLSPVGWKDQQKVTLLDCRANADTTEIDIPAEFAKDIISGDVLVLRCSELDVEKEIIWEQSEIKVRDVADASVSLASGLLSRFKPSKSEGVENVKTDAQVRAEEAERAAKAFKTKMDAAAEAKERAQEKALEAARAAEAALQMEAERSAEMERAAKAFEEAERLKQDELRRVEEERRIEEARIAEEARKLEEARLREVAAKKEADRIVALERYKAALDITRNEEVALKKRLTTLKEQDKTEAASIAAQSDDLESRRNFLLAAEETAKRQTETFKASDLKLNDSAAKLASVQSEADKLAVKREAVLEQLTQADLDYQDAQKKAEAAIALAEQRREQLETIRGQDSELSSRIATISETISATSLLTDDLTRKTQNLREKSEGTAAELTQANIEIEAIEKSLRQQVETKQALRIEIEATQQAIEDSQAKEIAHRGAIDHLESGGMLEDLSEINCVSHDYSHKASKAEAAATAALPTASSGLINRVRSTFTRAKDAEISVAVDDVELKVITEQADPILLEGMEQSPTFIRRHSSSLIAFGAVLGGIAILSGGVALNKSTSQRLEVKTTASSPTQVASVVAKASEPVKLDTNRDIAVPKMEPLIVAEPIGSQTTDGGLDALKITSNGASPNKMKFAEIVDPVGFAFELPDMMPTATPRKEELKLKSKPKSKGVEKTLASKETVKKDKSDGKSALKTARVETTKEQDTKETVNYPELTKDVQTRLSELGFYTGDIDGLQGSETSQAIRTFKQLYSLPLGDDITGAFLTELKRAKREHEAARVLAQTKAEEAAQSNVQIAEAPTPAIYDIVEAFPAAPIFTDTLPTAGGQSLSETAAPIYVAPVVKSDPEPLIMPEAEPVKVVSLPVISEPEPIPIIQDVIKEASLIKNAGARYPSVAQRRNHLVNVVIVVSFDIDETGKTQNLTVASNDYNGRFNTAFEQEAFKSIKKLRYEPKTVNGVAAKTIGKEKRIVFRVE